MNKNRYVYYDNANCSFSLKTKTVKSGLITPKRPHLYNSHIHDDMTSCMNLIFLLITVMDQDLKSWMS